MSTVLTSRFTTAEWRRALTLRERLATVATSRALAARSAASASAADVAVGRWRDELSLQSDDEYETWLERNGWSDEIFRALLTHSPGAEAEPSVPRPAWLEAIADAYHTSASTPADCASLAGFAAGPVGAFLALAEPLVRQAVARVRDGAARLRGAGSRGPFDPHTVHTLFLGALAQQLTSRVDRTLTLELHVAKLEGCLAGDIPEQRFESFAGLLRQPEYVDALFQTYPVLGRQLVEAVAQWSDYVLEFLRHLSHDWEEIGARFADGQELGPLVRVDGGVGDTHRDGRSVQIVTFDSGLRLVYKPHSLDVDQHFQELLAWINDQGFRPVLRAPAILPREGYGWSEFVESADCGSPEEVERFYERQGGFLAILYALEAIDFHMENLIAAGEYPMLVDLEALFHPRLSSAPHRGGSRALAYERMQHTVLRVGLLPQRGGENSPKGRFDSSGLGGGAEQLSPTPVLRVQNAGTDEMRFVREHVMVRPGSNRARLGGRTTNAHDHCEAIVRGFAAAYELLRRGRGELARAGGVLDRFASDEIRVVLRATRTYLRVLREASHPSLLGDAADHERLLQRLHVAVAQQPSLARVLAAETSDLRTGNVPIFTSRPGSCDLWTSRGDRVPDFFDQSGLDGVRQRVASLDAADLARQLWFIRASLTTLALTSHAGRVSAVRPLPERPAPADHRSSRRELIETASSLAGRIEELAIWDGGAPSWYGITLARDDRWVLDPVGVDLFAGASGIALFLGYAAESIGRASYKQLALTLAREARDEVATSDADAAVSPIGPFTGWAGWIYTLAHLGQLFRDESLLDAAHQIRVRVVPGVEADDTLDVIGGSAGLIGALAALHACDPTRGVLRDIVRCADHLLGRAERAAGGGLAWRTSMPASAPLTGFSHGASGIAWALLQAAAFTGEDRYGEAARLGMAYERAVFLPELGNWPDFRSLPGRSDEDASPMMAWCHGAPGIGLARLRALAHLDDPALRTDLDAALSTTVAQGSGHGLSHSLCHGDLGNAELIAEAGRIFCRPELTEHAARVAGSVVAAVRDTGPVCGTPNSVEVPGLMTGLAGIGLGLLRMADPHRVPSVLTLDPPRWRAHGVA